MNKIIIISNLRFLKGIDTESLCTFKYKFKDEYTDSIYLTLSNIKVNNH